MRKWKYIKTSALLEGEPLIIIMMIEDDTTNDDFLISERYGRGVTESQFNSLMDEIEFRKYKRKIENPLFDCYDYDDDWTEDYYGPEWYENEEFFYGKKMASKKKRKRRCRSF